MKWSWRIGRLAGIDIFVHMTFPLLLVWAGLSYLRVRGDPSDVVVGLTFVGFLFGIVVLHELGHALMARRFGIATNDITLLPIGGVARLMRMPADPRQEFLVALAGPAVNVVLAALLGAVVVLFTDLDLARGINILFGHPLTNLFWVNVGLAVFNMIPAFPMDGGRVLRSLLAMRLEYGRATRIAAGVGQLLAVAFGIWGLFGNPILVVIATFVWIGAKGEMKASRTNRAIPEIPVRVAMISDFHRVTPDTPVAVVAQIALRGPQRVFPVSSHGRLVGLITLPRLIEGMRRVAPTASAEEIMLRDVATADSEEPIDSAWARLQANRDGCLPVLTAGVLVGLLTADHLTMFFQLQQAAAERARTETAGR